jgi:hypothetical protein
MPSNDNELFESSVIKEADHSPNNRECKRRINMNKQTCHFVQIVEHQTIPPCNHSTGQRAMGKCIACDEKPLALRKEPEVNEIEDGDVVA